MEENHKLDEALECSVCLDTLSIDNKVLPCQHTFCTQCLLAVSRSLADQNLDFRCPECRCLVSGDIDNLPSNIILKRVLCNLNSPKSKGRPPETSKEDEPLLAKSVRKRVLPLADSDETGDSEEELLVSRRKKGRKSKPVYISEDESCTEVASSGEATGSESEATQGYGTDDVSQSDAGTSEATSSSDEEASESNSELTSEADLPNLDTRSQHTPEDQRTKADGGSSTRKSLRIKKKQSRVFRKPKKADVFNAIPSLSETDKSMSEYRPRKLVTDFTKVNSHYNYDPDYTSGEDNEMADFLDDDYEYVDDDGLVSEDSNYDPKVKNKHQKNKTKKGRKKTIASDNSSADVTSGSNTTEYSTEDSDSAFAETPKCSASTFQKRKKKGKFQRVQRSQSSSSDLENEVSDTSESVHEKGFSDEDSEMGELSRSILEKVNERSRTMSERKRQQVDKFKELKRVRKRRQRKQ